MVRQMECVDNPFIFSLLFAHMPNNSIRQDHSKSEKKRRWLCFKIAVYIHEFFRYFLNMLCLLDSSVCIYSFDITTV